MKVIKRNGQEIDFDVNKIKNAILHANNSVPDTERISNDVASTIANSIYKYAQDNNLRLNVEDIQNLVIEEIMKSGYYHLAREYTEYRYKHELARKSNTIDGKILSLVNRSNQELIEENANKDPIINSTQRDYIAGEVSKDIMKRLILPKDLLDAHDQGMIHIHDMDYAIMHMNNCGLVNLEDMLNNGTVISGTMIEKPHSFLTACNIASQIVAQVASSQFGGQTLTLSHLTPFVRVSFVKYMKKALRYIEQASVEEINEFENWFNTSNVGIYLTPEYIADHKRAYDCAMSELKEEITSGIQTFNYQLLTLMTTNGQTPFVTVFMYLNEAKDEIEKQELALVIEEVLHQRIKGIKSSAGIWTSPTFPKLIYALEEDNISEDSKYWYLTKLAAECTAKRMVPDYISEKVMKEYKIDANGDGHCFPSMGCRSFLNTYLDENNKPKYYGRFNQGVVTLNLVDVACSSGKDINKFWQILGERLELCHRALRLKHENLLGTPSDVAPILWQHGAYARLAPGEKLDKLLFNDYSTISLGYAGLWECVYHMTGSKLTESLGQEFGLLVMQKMNDYCSKWRETEHIGYGIYGTPIESTTYKLSKCLQSRFGIIKGVTDKKYITNSYHIHVAENISAFQKLYIESKFQKLSTSGAISYVEIPNLQDNLDAVLGIIKYMYNTIMYAEMNTKLDKCLECGYDKEIPLVESEGKWIFKCPCCGNTNNKKMDITRRVCGYLGKANTGANQGRLEDIASRVVHVGNGTTY